MPETRHDQHVLVLGASGKLGRMLRRWWQDFPPEGVILHWQYREISGQDGVEWSPGDPVPTGLPQISAVVALWGVTPGEGRDLAENSRLALAAMDLGRALGVERVLHCSSAAVYEPGPDPLREDMAGGAINAYGMAKLDMERTIADHAALDPTGPHNCILRIGNVSGGDSLFAALERGVDPITLDRFPSGDGPCRSYISPPLLAQVLTTLLGMEPHLLPGILNVAAPTPVAMESIARACGRDIAWKPAPEGAAPMVWLDIERLLAILSLADDSPTEIAAYWRMLKDPE